MKGQAFGLTPKGQSGKLLTENNDDGSGCNPAPLQLGSCRSLDCFEPQGIETRDMWVEVFRRFGKENSIINAYDFYAGDSSLFPSISGV